MVDQDQYDGAILPEDEEFSALYEESVNVNEEMQEIAECAKKKIIKGYNY